MTTELKQLIRELHEHGMIKFGDFTLRNGSKSPIYVDLRDLPWFPDTLALAAASLTAKLNHLHQTGGPHLPYSFAGLPMAGLPIAVAVGLATGLPVGYPRPTVKDHGTRKAIEGRFQAGDQVIVIDDLITDGGAKLDAIAPLRAAGLKVEHALVILDREQGGKESLRVAGVELHALFTLRQAVKVLVNRIPSNQYREVVNYLESANKSGATA
jgi:uridine monophosphate synthetase